MIEIYLTMALILFATTCSLYILMNEDKKRADIWYKLVVILLNVTFISLIGGFILILLKTLY